MHLDEVTWEPAYYAQFQKWLLEQAEPEYQKFNESLLSTTLPTIGLRLPLLRKMAKEIAKGEKEAFLKVCGTQYHEERMLYGMVACYLPYETFLAHSDCMAEKYIENWAICDTFATSLKRVLRKHKTEYFAYLTKYLKSSNPWAVRLGLVVMLAQYLEEDTITEVLARTMSVQSEAYYVRMAQAWLLATAWAKFPKETDFCLHQACLDEWTARKFVQKAKESRRVLPEHKVYLKTWLDTTYAQNIKN